MDGDIHPSVIVEFNDGHVHSFELDYQIKLSLLKYNTSFDIDIFKCCCNSLI
jgi:hypothetical protein